MTGSNYILHWAAVGEVTDEDLIAEVTNADLASMYTSPACKLSRTDLQQKDNSFALEVNIM